MSSGFPIPTEPIGDGVLYDAFAIQAATRGQPFEILVTENAAATLPFLLPNVHLSFYDLAGKEVRATSFAPADSEGRIRALVPDDASRAAFWSCETGPVRATFYAGAFPA